MEYEEDVAHFDIKTYRFSAAKDLFDDPETYAPNRCYCVKKPCFGQGLLDISACKKGILYVINIAFKNSSAKAHWLVFHSGAPVVMSAPHFYQGDPKYRDAVVGLNPVKEKHETYLDVEPVSISFFFFHFMGRDPWNLQRVHVHVIILYLRNFSFSSKYHFNISEYRSGFTSCEKSSNKYSSWTISWDKVSAMVAYRYPSISSNYCFYLLNLMIRLERGLYQG